LTHGQPDIALAGWLGASTLAGPELMFDTQQDVQVCRRLQRAMALPIYTLALILS
jgi:hypothetical protein